MAKGKRSKKPELKEEQAGPDLKEKLKSLFDRYGYLAAFGVRSRL
jgi:hypothetical protein